MYTWCRSWWTSLLQAFIYLHSILISLSYQMNKPSTWACPKQDRSNQTTIGIEWMKHTPQKKQFEQNKIYYRIYFDMKTNKMLDEYNSITMTTKFVAKKTGHTSLYWLPVYRNWIAFLFYVYKSDYFSSWWIMIELINHSLSWHVFNLLRIICVIDLLFLEKSENENKLCIWWFKFFQIVYSILLN